MRLWTAPALTMSLLAAAALHGPAAVPGTESGDVVRYRRAADYSASLRGVSMLVMHEGRIVFEDYPNGGGRERAWELASGTKSFSGLIAVAAIGDGWLRWDERVSSTITEWADDPARAPITVADLLSLTSGIAPGGIARPPTYADAVRIRSAAPIGSRFQYGPAPFQIFGELMRRKLAARGGGRAVDYLGRRVLAPLGVTPARWRTGRDGQPHMAQGAALTARAWAQVGELVRLQGRWHGTAVLDAATLDRLFVGSGANPMYGLSWWLARPIDPARARAIRLPAGAIDLAGGLPAAPADLVFAGGAGGQRLYVSRTRRLVIVRQATGIVDELLGRGGRERFSDAEFLARVFGG